MSMIFKIKVQNLQKVEEKRNNLFIFNKFTRKEKKKKMLKEAQILNAIIYSSSINFFVK